MYWWAEKSKHSVKDLFINKFSEQNNHSKNEKEGGGIERTSWNLMKSTQEFIKNC